MKYETGTKIQLKIKELGENKFLSGIIESTKNAPDFIVKWDDGEFGSYTEAWMDRNCRILGDIPKIVEVKIEPKSSRK